MNDHFGRQSLKSESGIYDVIRFFTVSGTLVILLLISIYLMTRGFQAGYYAGIRSVAGFLLPLVLGSFVYLFKRSWLDRMAAWPLGVTFSGALAIGLAIMFALRHLAQLPLVPLAELLVGACLSILVFAPGSLHGLTLSKTDSGDRPLAYYFGVVVGMLTYVVVFGFPTLGEIG